MSTVTFAQASHTRQIARDAWKPYLVPKEDIDAEIGRLLEGPMPASGFRSASIVHPEARDGVPSFTPVTEVSVNVLRPGESTPPRRGNYSLVETAIQGYGTVEVDDPMHVDLHDVWTIPAMHGYAHRNSGEVPWAWLTYSNAPSLIRTGAYYAEDGPFERSAAPAPANKTAPANPGRAPGPIRRLPSTGTELRSYEYLVDIEPVANPPLHWAWADMEPHIPTRRGDNEDPDKRGIWLMYNPATERRQGTTPIHFATYAGAAPGTPPFAGTRGHFHISASINYHTRGYGYSVVDGERIDWKAGDLLFSAPSWSEHAHYHGAEGWTVLTVQDHPLHISMGSLLWQEDIDAPILSLGNEEGQKGYVFPRQAGR
jgi:gentisate 1,2-dioxygenase